MIDYELMAVVCHAAKRVVEKPACHEWDELRRSLNLLADRCGESYRPWLNPGAGQSTPGYARQTPNREEEPLKDFAKS